ncbi:hypothetical protein ALTBGP9_00833 [Alteromonas macleodii]|nr:hypothetical protein ALT831_00903 [Alteromonas macleodii]CAI3936952.1 hypothetical protein ALTBGP9_00833 [Alteromonas macleodii]CAI3937995.1 hypothetical protein ALTBGP6_00903 [Alteromonas macleodii]CAI3938036.1 hypothetical protein ALTBGP14_00903 [Alteromonas macleodii]VTO38581.1 hypothetical protein ALTBGP6_00903 [Alteromonas macleodii]
MSKLKNLIIFKKFEDGFIEVVSKNYLSITTAKLIDKYLSLFPLVC